MIPISELLWYTIWRKIKYYLQDCTFVSTTPSLFNQLKCLLKCFSAVLSFGSVSLCVWCVCKFTVYVFVFCLHLIRLKSFVINSVYFFLFKMSSKFLCVSRAFSSRMLDVSMLVFYLMFVCYLDAFSCSFFFSLWQFVLLTLFHICILFNAILIKI